MKILIGKTYCPYCGGECAVVCCGVERNPWVNCTSCGKKFKAMSGFKTPPDKSQLDGKK